MKTIELDPDTQRMIMALASIALQGALEALHAGRYPATEADLQRVVAALQPREFAVAALVIASDPKVSNAEMAEAARVEGARAVREALGPVPMAALN
jgi:hypothetical protein